MLDFSFLCFFSFLRTGHHFVCFVEVEKDLYQLDGRLEIPINHGPCENILYSAVEVIQTQFIDLNPTSNLFNIMALVQQS